MDEREDGGPTEVTFSALDVATTLLLRDALQSVGLHDEPIKPMTIIINKDPGASKLSNPRKRWTQICGQGKEPKAPYCGNRQRQRYLRQMAMIAARRGKDG